MTDQAQTNRIPFKKINLGKALERIAPLIESGFIGLGNVVFETEKKLAEYVGAKEVVLVDSCTSALFLSLKYEMMKAGKQLEVVMPSMTVPLAVNAAMEAGCKLIFDTRTDWVGRYYSIRGTTVVDSAHELRRDQYLRMQTEEGWDDNLKLCFSFYPTKTIGSADGGAIATNDSEFARWCRSAATYGRNQSTKYQNSWDYDTEMVGYKRHYTNLQAAIVAEQLDRLDQTNAVRQRIVKTYNENLGYDNKSDYLYRINVENRDEFVKFMADKGIEVGVHFKPIHLMTPYKDHLVVQDGKTEEVGGEREQIEEAYQKTVSLPLYADLTVGEIMRIIEAVKEWTNK
jgi:dTDP-4-amino-4,6-dideoxygalactose transaminase